MANNYEVGTAAWQPDPTEGWVASEVKEKNVDGDKVTLIFLLENGEVCLCFLACLRSSVEEESVDYALTAMSISPKPWRPPSQSCKYRITRCYRH